MWWVVVSLVLSWSSQTSAVDDSVHVSCKDENNKKVDWYILYKAPRVAEETGQRYIYIDDSGTRLINTLISDPNGVLANTLRPMFTNNKTSSFGFLSYNDQPPPENGGSSEDHLSINITMQYGHSKGVVLGDSGTQSALWLMHSTPKFPFSRDQNNFWPPNGNKNGQTFMCVSLNFTDLQTIGTHLRYIHARIIGKDIPNNFSSEIESAANEVSAAPPGTFQNLKVGNKELRILAKKKGQTADDGDLYVQLAQGFNSDVDAQVWGFQPNKDQSYCEEDQPKVMNVENITVDQWRWSWTEDHSKWAVTTADNIHWTCICDMNRAVSQYKRPGGALCIRDAQINKRFTGFVRGTLECGQDPNSSKGYHDSVEDPGVTL